jgi:hypothetical protein
MLKKLTAATAALALIAAAGVSAQAAPKVKLKPLGYIYGQCTTKTTCAYQVSTDPTQKKIALSSTAICQTGALALARLGYVPVKRGGKFSVNKAVTVTDAESYRSYSVQVQLSGKLKVGKSLTGTLKVTTTATDCTADSGVAKSFAMKYKGPYFGG